jgi:hypothetical protein
MPSSFNSIPKSWAAALAGVLAVAGFALILGCNSSVPPVGAYSAPTSVVNQSRVDEFQSTGVPPNPVYINPNLFELNNPPTYVLKNGWHPFISASIQPSSVTVVNNFKDLATGTGDVEGPGLGANGEDYAFHETGAVTDLGDFEYPSVDLQTQFEGGAFYDAGAWHGIKFMMKIGPGDTALHRIFSVPVYQTVAVAGGGGCTQGPKLCYDHFAADYSAGTGGQWKQFNYLFSDLHQLVAGAIPNPPTLSGLNLQQVMWLQWEEGRNNSPGICTLDLWIDQVEFY